MTYDLVAPLRRRTILSRLAAAAAVLGALISLGVTPAAAGSASGTVTEITTENQCSAIFKVSGPVQSQAACNQGGQFAVNLSLPQSRGTLSLVLTAYALGKSITVAGLNVCDVWYNAETVWYVLLTP